MKKVGAIPVIADVFNRESVFSVLEETNPDIVIHQLTSLSSWNFEDNAKELEQKALVTLSMQLKM